MTNDMLIQLLTDKQPLAEVRMGSEYIEAFIPRENLHDFMVMIKNDSDLAFDYLFCLTGVDFSDHLQVIYHLESTVHNHIMVVKVKTENRETPEVDTVSDIWPTAESHENEVYDLLGIKFNNHPELRRLFLDEGWGFPLRKDFQDDVHVVVR
jgi:NADH:ubiquinone oxidoreductase subunit C